MDQRADADIINASTGIIFNIAEMDAPTCFGLKPLSDQG
jgi:hypothetical protein